MTKASWFAFYPGDYLRDTSRLSTVAHGAYLLLLLDYYATGRPIPDDDNILARICKLTTDDWKALRPDLSKLFSIENGMWNHKRVELEMQRREERRHVMLKAAKLRWTNRSAPEPLPAPERKRARVNGQPGRWWKTHEGIDARGRELGLASRNGESYEAYKQRIIDHAEQATKK